MRLLTSRATRVPSPSGLLCAVLAMLLLTPSGPLASGESAQPAGCTPGGFRAALGRSGEVSQAGWLGKSFSKQPAYNSVPLSTPASPIEAAEAAVVRELRCMCLTTTPGIHPKMISDLQVIPAGPQCSKAEVIATLKNGKEVCLDPKAPLIKKIVQKMLDSGKKKN
uniref:C-X-C motif chemokine n=1 Tax=Sus scrofa TaxID=9823 RepID=A0A8D1G6A3_PIG